jgi:phosphonate dehydrogenase
LTHKVHPEVLAILEGECDVVANQTEDSLSRREVLARAADAEGLMVFMPDCVDDDFLSACPSLRVVGAALKGYDNFDVQACTSRGVWFTIVEDLLTVPTAELTIGLMIGLARQMLPADRYVREGKFRGWRPRFFGAGIAGSTVGIVGMGAVGRAIAERLQGFGCTVVYHDRVRLPEEDEKALAVSPLNFEDLVSDSDFLVLALPLTGETFHIADRRTLMKMKRGSFLINPGRGSLVDEETVVEVLETGVLAGYAADVFEFEDWARPDRPGGVAGALAKMRDKTFLTPHIGSAVGDVRRAIAMEAAVNILQALRGEHPAGAINLPAGVETNTIQT